jgi:hypothetical protein
MLIRFVLRKRDPASTKRQGILVAAHELRDEGTLTTEEHQILREALAWFNKHLEVPVCLKRPENRRALWWFKDSAQQPLRHMWNLVYILRDHGLHVDVIKRTIRARSSTRMDGRSLRSRAAVRRSVPGDANRKQATDSRMERGAIVDGLGLDRSVATL